VLADTNPVISSAADAIKIFISSSISMPQQIPINDLRIDADQKSLRMPSAKRRIMRVIGAAS
jgi:hypothetical protein